MYSGRQHCAWECRGTLVLFLRNPYQKPRLKASLNKPNDKCLSLVLFLSDSTLSRNLVFPILLLKFHDV